ncbi:MAG: BACON domain-containing protein [Bacteroidaceae bacterium]|nr:BACON domain-containing protein [Bacteroidaceae bacterium]
MKKKLCNYLLTFCGTLLLVACHTHDERLSLSVSEVTFDYLGGEKEITLYSECSECGDPIPWEVTQEDPSFLNITPSFGSGGKVTVTLTAEMSQSGMQESERIKFNNGIDTIYLRVSQDPHPTVECYAEPTEVLDMAKGIACGVKIGNSCASYYIALYEESRANMLSDDELREDIKKKSDKMYYPSYPENSPDGRYGTDYQDVLAWYHDIHPNTKYVIVTCPYTSDGEEGAVYRKPVTTKNDKLQPQVVLSEITPETTNNGDFWKWSTSMEYNCQCYLVYACVSEDLFPSFQRDDNGVVLAWEIHKYRKILKEDDVTAVNFNSASKNAARCREYIYPKLTNNTKMVDLERKSYDKYLEVVILAYHKSDNFETAELSGVVTDVKFDISAEPTPSDPASSLDIELNGYQDDVCMDEEVPVSTLDINTYSLSFAAASETKNLTLTGNDSWSVTSKPTWCTVSPNSGVGSSTINVTPTKNTTTEKRTGSIVIEGEKSQKRFTVSVTQEPGGENTIGKDGYDDDTSLDEEVSYHLFMPAVPLDFTSAAGYKDVSVSSNDDWNATSSESWCTVSPASGSGDGTLRITVIKNTQNQKRQAQITVKGRKSGQTATLKVQQDAGGETTIGKDGFSGDINID